MLVHALVAAVRTRPEPAVLSVLDGVDEVFAYLIRCRFRVAVFAHNHLPQLLLVPVFHAILLLGLLVRFPRVLV